MSDKKNCYESIDYVITGRDVDNVVALSKYFDLRVPKPVVFGGHSFLAVHYIVGRGKFCVDCNDVNHYKLLYDCYCDNEEVIKRYLKENAK